MSTYEQRFMKQQIRRKKGRKIWIEGRQNEENRSEIYQIEEK